MLHFGRQHGVIQSVSLLMRQCLRNGWTLETMLSWIIFQSHKNVRLHGVGPERDR